MAYASHLNWHSSVRGLALATAFLFPGSAPALPPANGGPETLYTRLLESFEQHWPPAWFSYDEATEGVFRLTCHRHPERPFFMGASVTQTINDSPDKVIAILDNVEKYGELFAGFEEIKRTETTPTGFSVFWHRPIPVPFVPDLRYETTYLNKSYSPDKKTYRYQMKKHIDLLKSVDGLIVVEAVAPKKTRFTQIIFWDGKYGPKETFSPTGIWKDNMRDVYHSNYAIKLRAENPGWDADKLKAEVQKVTNEKTIEACVEARKFFPGVTEGKDPGK